MEQVVLALPIDRLKVVVLAQLHWQEQLLTHSIADVHECVVEEDQRVEYFQLGGKVVQLQPTSNLALPIMLLQRVGVYQRFSCAEQHVDIS